MKNRKESNLAERLDHAYKIGQQSKSASLFANERNDRETALVTFDAMLHVLYTNHYHIARSALAVNIAQERKRHEGACAVFRSIDVIVPNDAIKDDIARRFCDEPCLGGQGALLGVKFQQVSAWFRPYGGIWLGAGQTGQELEWYIWQILGNPDFVDRHARLRNYLSGKTAVERYELSLRIAALFTKYANYRLDWVLEWLGVDSEAIGSVNPERRLRERRLLEASEDFAWQRDLFAELSNRWDGARRLKDLRQRFEHEDIFADAGQSLHIFLPESVPPLLLPYLQRFAQDRQLWLYLYNPSREYWFEGMLPAHETKHMPRDFFVGWERKDRQGGNEYLRGNAHSIRALIDRIWRFTEGAQTAGVFYEDDATIRQNVPHRSRNTKGIDFTDLNALSLDYLPDGELSERELFYYERENDTILNRLHNAILHDADLAGSIDETDRSVRVVGAAGAIREIEGVIDWIHALMSDDNRLCHEDFLVVMPDVSTMAPAIRSVMSSLSPERAMPWQVVGLATLEDDRVARCVLAIVEFIARDAGFDAFVELLSDEVIRDRLELSRESGAMLGEILRQSGFLSGINAGHVSALERSGKMLRTSGQDPDGTLSRALERLVLAALRPNGCRHLLADVCATSCDEQRHGEDHIAATMALAELFAALQRLVDQVVDEDGWFAEREPAFWLEWINVLVRDVLLEDIGQEYCTGLREAVNELVSGLQACGGSDSDRLGVTVEVFCAGLRQRLRSKNSLARAADKVTFASMKAFAGLPYKAVAVIGADGQGAFPGINRTEEFDLCELSLVQTDGVRLSTRRRGDRDARSDNRSLFFRTVMSAQEFLYVSYDAGSEPSNSALARPPSPVVEDLVRALAHRADSTRIEKRVRGLIEMPLPVAMWDPENFRSTPSRFFVTHDSDLAQVVDATLNSALPQRNAPQIVAQGACPRFFVEENGLQVIPVARLGRLLFKPESETSRGLDLENPLGESEERPEGIDAISTMNGLDHYRYLEMLCEEIDRGVDEKTLLERAKADPRFGAEPVREAVADEVLQVAQTLQMCRKVFAHRGPKVQLPARTVPIASVFAMAIRLERLDVVQEEDEPVLTVFTGKRRTEKIGDCTGFSDPVSREQQALLLQMVWAAAGVPLRLRLVRVRPCLSEDDSRIRCDVFEFAAREQQKAIEQCADLLKMARDQESDMVLLEDLEPGQHRDRPQPKWRPLWFGRESDVKFVSEIADRNRRIRTLLIPDSPSHDSLSEQIGRHIRLPNGELS